jgi:hypothetical protein
MRHGLYGMILAGSVVAAAPAMADTPAELGCGRAIVKDGTEQLVMDTKLHVLEQTSSGAAFDAGPAPPGASIKSIFCARSDIVPAPSDYKVVQAGYPLMLFTRDKVGLGRTRIAVLEMSDGQLRVRSVGEIGFTPEMIQRIQAFQDASLPQFGKVAAR